MITGTEIYWITRMDYAQTALLASGVVLVLVSGFGLFFSICEYCENNKSKPLKFALPIFILCLMIFVGGLLTPNTKEMCAIKVLPMIINNENVQELPNKVVDLANEWLEELKPKQGEQK